MFYVGGAVSIYIASYSSLARGNVFWWRWSLNRSNLSLKGVLLDYKKESKAWATASEEGKAKVRKARGRNNVVSRNLASTGRAIFQSSKLREAFYCALCVYLAY